MSENVNSMPPPGPIFGGPDPSVSGDELNSLRSSIGLSRAQFGRLVGLSERSVASWESGVDLKESSFRNIVQVGRLLDHLKRAFPEPGSLAQWLNTPNQAFNNQKPLEVIERGHIDRLWRMVYHLESGEPG